MIIICHEIWAFIPARSGSCLKNKNIKKLKGKPLIYYSINTAFKSKCFNKVIFSSDSKNYIYIALKINKNLEIHKNNKKISSATASEYSVFKDYIDKNKKKMYSFLQFYPVYKVRKFFYFFQFVLIR